MLNTLEERYKERLSKKMEGENLKIEFEPKYTKVGTTKEYRNIVLNYYHLTFELLLNKRMIFR